VIDAKDFGAFSAAASFLMLSLIPMAVTKAEPPPLPPKGQLRIRELYHSSMISIVTIILLGFANGSFWSIVPAYVEHLQLGPGTVASFMTAVIIGSALSPYPVGRMSDKFDRRIVIAVASGLAMIFEIAMTFSHTTTPIVLYALGFSIGATIPVLYPLVSALSVDRLGAEKAVSVASTLLFLYCIGAIAGPVLAATMMTAFGDAMLFAQNAIAHAIITGFIILRLRHERAAPQHYRDATTDELPPQ
jgi:MFS family permease